jgi:hypothetical protein
VGLIKSVHIRSISYLLDFIIIIRRIIMFMMYGKLSTNTYAVDNLPSHFWGSNRPFDDKSAILCCAGSNEPLHVCITGKFSRLWFFNNSGDLTAQVSINVVPMCPSIATTSNKTIAVLSNPNICRSFYLSHVHT